MSALEKMRKLCAGLEDTSERTHHGEAMFYVGKKPFASAGDKNGIVVGLEPEHAATLVERDERFRYYSRAQHAVAFDPATVPQKEWEPLVARELRDSGCVGEEEEGVAR
jgi:hypothetical protein